MQASRTQVSERGQGAMATSSHRAAIGRFTAACQADERLVAAFLGGSYAAGTADAYSDLDLYLIVADASYDDFFAQRRRFLGQLGDPVFLDDFDGFGFDMVLFIYADGVDGELVLARTSAFVHLPSGPFRVLLDRDGILPRQAFPPITPPTAEEQREHVRWLVAWFWRDLSQLSRWLARGRLWSAYAHLEMARHTCLGLVRAQHAWSPALGSYEKIEHVVEAEDLHAFQHTFCRVERAALVEAVRGLLAIYLQVAPPLATAHGLAYPAKLAHAVLERLEQGCGVVVAGARLPSEESGDRHA